MKFFLTFFCLIWVLFAQAQSTYYWVGTSAGVGNWANTLSWASTSGGAGGAYAQLPAFTDSVVFDRAATVTIGSSAICQSMHISHNAVRFIFGGVNAILEIHGSLVVSTPIFSNFDFIPITFRGQNTHVVSFTSPATMLNSPIFFDNVGNYTVTNLSTTNSNSPAVRIERQITNTTVSFNNTNAGAKLMTISQLLVSSTAFNTAVNINCPSNILERAILTIGTINFNDTLYSRRLTINGGLMNINAASPY